jgi:hypothetical protein
MAQGNNKVVSKAWVADNGDGTYKTPILDADYSDPDVIRVGDDYYMTSSSFNCIPGLPPFIRRIWSTGSWLIMQCKSKPLDVYDKPGMGMEFGHLA